MSTSKVRTLHVTNFKAISEMEMDLDGASVIVTGANNSGKTSFLTGIIDRIRGEKPEMILKEGTKAGKSVLHLTTGERFEWEYADNDKGTKEKLIFYTKENYATAVTQAIRDRFFPPGFDIDKFLQSQPAQQSKMLQKLAGVDFTQVDADYAIAYNKRTEAGRIHNEKAAALKAIDPPKYVESVDVTELIAEKEKVRKQLNELYVKNKEDNAAAKKEYDAAVAAQQVAREEHEKAQDEKDLHIQVCNEVLGLLEKHGYTGKEVKKFIDALPRREEFKADPIPEPTYKDELPDDTLLKEIDEKLNNAALINDQAAKYEAYIKAQNEEAAAKHAWLELDKKVKETEGRKKQMILDAKFPPGIEITETGITVDGFPMDKNQISKSKLYIAALRLGSLTLGEVKTLHFDASPLDRNSLAEIEIWANAEGLQLMIERPDWNSGEIKYEIINHENNPS